VVRVLLLLVCVGFRTNNGFYLGFSFWLCYFLFWFFFVLSLVVTWMIFWGLCLPLYSFCLGLVVVCSIWLWVFACWGFFGRFLYFGFFVFLVGGLALLSRVWFCLAPRIGFTWSVLFLFKLCEAWCACFLGVFAYWAGVFVIILSLIFCSLRFFNGLFFCRLVLFFVSVAFRFVFSVSFLG